MASTVATKRLKREYIALSRNPISNIVVKPNEDNILQWHFVILGKPLTVYAGGEYHGQLMFPNNYPLAPPSVSMLTPSGRFKVGQSICLTLTSFHPELWNPHWTIGAILDAIYEFMLTNEITTGGIRTSNAKKQELATMSKAYNRNDPRFLELFPELVEKPLSDDESNESTEIEEDVS